MGITGWNKFNIKRNAESFKNTTFRFSARCYEILKNISECQNDFFFGKHRIIIIDPNQWGACTCG